MSRAAAAAPCDNASIMCSPSIAIDLRCSIRAGKLKVDVQPDMVWTFLRTPGFRLADFGDVTTRSRRLGKWITAFAPERLASEARRLLPLIDQGLIKLAKVENAGNDPRKLSLVVVYCLDQDAEIRAALEQLGWTVNWKYNSQTFSERSQANRFRSASE